MIRFAFAGAVYYSPSVLNSGAKGTYVVRRCEVHRSERRDA